jgi:hypothetical protein
LTRKTGNDSIIAVEGRHPFGVTDTYNPKRCRT